MFSNIPGETYPLNQRGLSIWIIGLSGAGKTTLSNALQELLKEHTYFSIVQDADIVRLGLNKGLGYSIEDRLENIRRAAEVSKLLIENQVISINAFICPTNLMRQVVYDTLKIEHVFLIYLSTPLQICEERDVKGMYAKARKGEIKDFTGISAVFEIPDNSDLIIDTTIMNIEESVELILKKILPKIQL